MNAFQILEYNQILETLCEAAVSEKAKEQLRKIKPYLSEQECLHKMKETTLAKELLESYGTPPLAAMTEVEENVTLSEKDGCLLPEQLENIARFATSCRRMQQYLKRAEGGNNDIAYYGRSFADLNALGEEIAQCIQADRVLDGASTSLRDVRRRIENANSKIREKMESILRDKKAWFADSYSSIRNGRFVLPVKKEYKSKVSGTVVDTSGSGNTYFIEPSAIGKLQDELQWLQIEEENEVRTILYTLTAMVQEESSNIRLNMELMEMLDVIFAKGKLSVDMKANEVNITTERVLRIHEGRHPLLNREVCIPLEFQVGNGIRGVIITGPNTGGKTVALKTVGLLSLMAQSGLHVPARKDSLFTMNSVVLCDIGDGQSIQNNLSTFSSHITNVISILEEASEESLVLLDELGSGTDPAEGMGIAISILEELRRKGCLFLATTHYPEVKEYAAKQEGLINARMKFDRESLKPLYQLEIGEAGESCALYIAKRLGFPEHLLQIAEEAISKTDTSHVLGEMKLQDNTSTTPGKMSKKLIKPIQITHLSNKKEEISKSYQMGDSVMILPEKKQGIVYRPADERGEVIVQIQGVRKKVSYKRVKLLVSAAELYPPDYDFSIIFDSVEIRKARHQMSRKYQPGVSVAYEDEE